MLMPHSVPCDVSQVAATRQIQSLTHKGTCVQHLFLCWVIIYNSSKH